MADRVRRSVSLPAWPLALLALLGTSRAASAQDTPALAAASSAVPETRGPLAQVVVLGASGSAGFFLSVDMATVLGALFDFEHDPRALEPSPRSPARRVDATFFLHPLEEGEAQVDFALERDPTLVVAFDFLFWFAYGALDVRGEPMHDEESRLELLEHGLALLDRLPCPILVSDLPDMSAAIGKMLMASQVPTPRMRMQLNERIHAWAAERARVHVLPLDRVHTDLVDGGAVRLGDYCWPEARADGLLQWDRLHPTLEGLVGIVHLIGLELVDAGWVPAEELALELAPLMERFGVESAARRCDGADPADAR